MKLVFNPTNGQQFPYTDAGGAYLRRNDRACSASDHQ